MPSKAGFTLSLDCEGLWGMADQPAVVRAGVINHATLDDTYAFIRRTLDETGLSATAAFVSCFAAGPEAVRNQLDTLEQLADLLPGWFSQVLPAVKAGHTSGWDGARHFRALQQAGHEMAWHGATHMPLTADTHADAIDLEIRLAKALCGDLDHWPETLVFPRNRVGHLGPLRAAGFKTYRASPPNGFSARWRGLANEWNVIDGRVHHKPEIRDGWRVSPAGFFLNWPSGARSMVPIGVTVARWKSLLRHAVAHGGYVHMWFHPHNLITAPDMKVTFEQIMKAAGELVRSGDMVSLTMAEANAHFGIDQVERKA